MATVECKSELVGGWFLGGAEPCSCWPQPIDFTFCQQLQHHQQIQQHQLHHHHLDFQPMESAELQQPLFPGPAYSEFSSPASFLTADGTSDCSGYLMASVPSLPAAASTVDCDDQQQPEQQEEQPSANESTTSGPSVSGRRSTGGTQRGAVRTLASAQSGAVSRCSGGEQKVKTPVMVAKRNARERRRVEAVNTAFARLRRYIPYEKRNKRLSKVKTLRITIEYIRLLEVVLDEMNGGIDIDRSANYQSLLKLAQRKEIAILLAKGS